MSPRNSEQFRFWPEIAWTATAGVLTSLVCAYIIFFTPGEFWRDDAQAFFMPVYVDMNRGIHEGCFPLISTSSWIGGRLGGEYQCGLFSLFHWPVILAAFSLDLPLAQTAAAIVLIYMAVCGAGAFRLGRATGLTRPNAIVVSLAAALNGWMLYWGSQTWMVFLTSCTWLPWFWWGLLLAQDRRLDTWRFLPAGFFLYLLLTAAHPHTNAMAAAVTAWLALRTVLAHRRIRRSWRLAASGAHKAALRLFFSPNLLAKLWPIGAAWVLGLALASPAILMLLDMFPGSERSVNGLADEDRHQWTVPVESVSGVVLPTVVTKWNGWDRLERRDSFELYGGFVPAVAFLAILMRLGRQFARRHAWEIFFLLGVLSLCCFDAYWILRYSFKWLCLFHLILGLLGAHALQEWPAEGRRQSLRRFWSIAKNHVGCWGIAFVAAALAWALLDAPRNTLRLWSGAKLLVGLCVLWTAFDWLARKHPRLRSFVPVAIMMIATVEPWSLFASRSSTIQWKLTPSMCEPGPFDKERLYFMVISRRDAYSTDSRNGLVRRFGNTPLYAGIKSVNGYSPMQSDLIGKLLHVKWHGVGFVEPQGAGELLPKESAPNGLLQLMGVDGIILSREFASYAPLLETQGWEIVLKTPREVMLHRDGPKLAVARSIPQAHWVAKAEDIVAGVARRSDGPAPAIILGDESHAPNTVSAFGNVDISGIAESRLGVRCHVANASVKNEGLVAFSRAWYPGYRAYLDGRPLKPCALNGIQAAVCIPPGAKGDLVLEYAPPAVRHGLTIALAGLTAAAVVAIPGLGRRRKNATSRK